MTLLYNDQEHEVRALLDPGSSIPVMSLTKARKWKLPIFRRTTLRPLTAFNNTTDGGSGRYYTDYLVLRH